MRNRREADSTETLNTSGRGQGATGLSRRSFLKAGAAGALITGGFALPFGSSASTADWISTLPASKRPTPYTRPFQPAPRLPYRELSDADGPYRLYTVTERLGNAQIIDGLPTPVLGYGYQGVDGQPRLSVPGPVISVDQGTRVKLRVKNDLPATHPQWRHPMHTSTHLHGSASLPQYDGYADDVTLPGQYKDYWYPNFQAARTLWYHDHGVHNTAQNAYSGLAAQYHLHDAAELDLLPQGRYDVPLTIGDAMFAADGSLAYSDRNHSGLWGDVVLVNGVPWPYMEVQRRVYRFRILAATLSRSFNFRLVNVANGQQVPVHVVATDGGLMPKSQQVASWRQAGAERYEVLVDFGQFKSLPAGSKFQLRNTSNDNNVDYLHTGKVMEFRLTNEPVTDTRNNTIPTTLVTSTVMGLTAAQSRRTRRLDLQHDDVTNEFQINSKTWHDVQDSGFRLLADSGGSLPSPGDVELWEIENKSGGWFHPLHIHLCDFKIISRTGGSGRVQPWEQGPKDVVYVGEGEIVRVLAKYDMVQAEHTITHPVTRQPYTFTTGKAGANGGAGGRYMIHCHNLPHEDHDMMQQFQVGSTPEGNDPITAAPARALPVDGVYDDGAEVLADKV
jgi:FtsP/CotA-like multicopper oxidase with cupredoxin domain